ncbi:MAG: endonuclease III [Spirochaetae bacterium HGW-Spirochaetae-1]|jgi:endonuclease-3|nr:MAG: endonuclease III [Spirochaetae bacterium HGW-Spirochaetae-1]
MDRKKSNLIQKRLRAWYGEVTPDLHFGNLYQLTIAVVLSAQTTDKQVNAVTPVLFDRYADFSSLAGARLPDVETIIKSTGFYRNKAKNIITLSRAVMERFHGTLPAERDALESLPGVGRKSANVILSMGFDIPALAVDTHVMRIANRLAYIRSEDPFRVEESLTALIPEKCWKITHLILIAHGRRTCTARNPRCSVCPIEDLCGSPDKTV